MKVILTGSTGFVGGEVLDQCLRNAAITSIIALSRRDLPQAAANPKLVVIILKDFKVYSDAVLEQLKGADACIWSIGTYNWDSVVELEHPEAFQNALVKVLDVKKTFRYVYLGGAFTETDQEKPLWFLAEGRRIRGLAQTKLLDFGKVHQNVEPYVCRASGIVARNGSINGIPLLGRLFWMITVRVEELAAAMVDIAVNGGSEPVVKNEVLVRKGKECLKRQI